MIPVHLFTVDVLWYIVGSKYWLKIKLIFVISQQMQVNPIIAIILYLFPFTSDFETDRGLRKTLHWLRNKRDGVSNHLSHDCLLNCLSRVRSKKTSQLRVTGLCGGNSPGTGEFPAQIASNVENISIWWRHHVIAKSQ